uniref:G_PROTEIN_RECEP_F1_2 domain-containing protein n=1 Tax=Panagrellus redivivus TaxID=6233 RepID=A0A7E4W2W9_PANRE
MPFRVYQDALSFTKCVAGFHAMPFIISAENRLDCNVLNFSVNDVTKHVSDNLGDRCVPPSLVLPTVIIYGLILILGVGGNLCTCLVIAKNKYMHSATNFYLFSLAISDLLMLVLGKHWFAFEILVKNRLQDCQWSYMAFSSHSTPTNSVKVSVNFELS